MVSFSWLTPTNIKWYQVGFALGRTLRYPCHDNWYHSSRTLSYLESILQDQSTREDSESVCSTGCPRACTTNTFLRVPAKWICNTTVQCGGKDPNLSDIFHREGMIGPCGKPHKLGPYEQWIIDFSRVFTFSGVCGLLFAMDLNCILYRWEAEGGTREWCSKRKKQRSITYAALLFAAPETQLRFS